MMSDTRKHPPDRPALLEIIQHLAAEQGVGPRELARLAGISVDTAARLLRQSDWRGLASVERALGALASERDRWQSVLWILRDAR